MSASKVVRVSSIVAHSSPGAERSMRDGSLERVPPTPSASANRLAGSIVITTTRLPSCAPCAASAAAVVLGLSGKAYAYNYHSQYLEETVFDVNMLIIDPKNVIVFNYNERVFEALHRYGITPHIVHFRHRYFWDGGIHCVTTDLHREGQMKNIFPDREN